ncbi:hypothetical protein [Actinomadura gamaensis]|uniref:Uncharacterized protein n=1 Tax=Actinomadura gamaensis TaxID=1763541 RepID=A0ABV9UAD2_9ACTN
MFRKLLVPPLLLALVLFAPVACRNNSKNASVSGSSQGTTPMPGTTGGESGSPGGQSGSPGGESPGVCPSKATKKFAKTRFVGDAGLAFGAFHRWIYKPYKAGTFKSGADGRKKAIVKAAAAGAFSVNRLNAARKMVNADPTLCGALKKPLDSLWNSLSGLTGKLKSGNADPSEIGSIGGAIDSFRQQAGKNGADIKDKNPPNF